MGRISQRSKRRAEKEFNIYFKSMEKETKNGIELIYYNRLLEWKDENGCSFMKYAEFLQSIDCHNHKPNSLSGLNKKELIILYNFAFNENIKL